MMDTELLTADEMCERLKTNFGTFRRTWRRWKHERVGEGNTLRSMRFYWRGGPVRAEAINGGSEVSDKERPALDRGRLPGRDTHRKEGRLPKSPRSAGMGRRTEELEAAARRYGFA